MTDRIKIICIAGFGDDKSMFAPLLKPEYSQKFNILPINLPGFGVAAAGCEITLNGLAEYVLSVAIAHNATYIMAHSVASIIATLAVEKSAGFITHIISLEGNLTAKDAYFSGKAADYDTAEEFRASFPKLLGEAAQNNAMLRRYLPIVMACDAQDLWSLGCDVLLFSDQNDVGARLVNCAKVFYLYNSKNCPSATLKWLDDNAINKYELKNSSHWAPLDSEEEMMMAIYKQFITN